MFYEIFEVKNWISKDLRIFSSLSLLMFIKTKFLIFHFSFTFKACTYKTDSVFLSSIKFGSKIKVIKNF